MSRKVPLKNYFILALVFFISVVGVFYARGWYNTTREYYAQNSVMTQVVREIKSDELSNYVTENQKFILYVASGKNMILKDFEDDFKGLIQDMDLSDAVLYMNLDGVYEHDFYGMLKGYASDYKLINDDVNSGLYVFENAKIVNVLNDVNNYTMKRLRTIIERWEIK